ncbi:dienelactone hydrolase family protein [Bdellovibrio sp. HCB209]|uniref:dienelactone hydrolase family protein n=1 Tax=Bdellovibrio sp. HCB209 TaxID=3394354 RepID=UPI0039B4A38F
MAYEKRSVQTLEGKMTVHIVTPEGLEVNELHRPTPALVVLQEAFGVNHHILNVCKKLADHGIIALAPELFHRAGDGINIEYTQFDKARPILAELTNERIIDDVHNTVALARGLPSVNTEKIGTIGFCMGGFAAVLASCHIPDLASVTSFYGGGMLEPRPGFGFKPFTTQFKSIRCPLFLGFGAEDQTIPSLHVEQIRDQMKAAGVRAKITVYPESNHGFLCDERSAYNPKTSQIAWNDIFNWLKECDMLTPYENQPN